jgi:hypothetical protein
MVFFRGLEEDFGMTTSEWNSLAASMAKVLYL